MRYTVYLDLLFLVNFTMDLWILLLEKKLLRLSATGLRLAIGAGLGSGWICLLVLAPLPPLLEQTASFLVAAVGIQWVTFSIHNGKTLAKSVVVFYFFAFLFGGIFSAVAERTGGIPASLLVCGGSLIGFGLFLGISWIQERRNPSLIPVELTWKGVTLKLKGLVDTGNVLYTKDGKPVHVLDASAASPWKCFSLDGVIWVPFRSVGKENGVLPAIVADTICLGEERVISGPIVAFSKYPVSENNRYQILIHSQEALP
ncbi:sigma-E processing peptidase SpoIIGA [Hominifimenecus sp. rT4P-3]|uniref:sigma-E processing peptidase SpoIIGA n=1 Tax=Hominifimenecus sp. rT4P-3 TaxID=3242979 RepID=UPI003DA49F76